MIPADYHIHTQFSCDCQYPMVDMCQAALDAGLQEVGFTEHFDLNPEDPCYRFFKIEEWWEEILRCRSIFSDALTIKAGVELGEPHMYRKETRSLLQAFDWDYSLGSLHWVGDMLVFQKEYFAQPAGDAYGKYFSELLEMVQGSEFDILAHMDVVKRYGYDYYGPYDPSKFESKIRNVLRACAASGKALEINTSTLRRPIGEPSPSSTLARWFREEGGEWFTFGSDAHSPEHVGYGQVEMRELMESIQIDWLAGFTDREKVPLHV